MCKSTGENSSIRQRFIHLSDLHIRDRAREFSRAVRITETIAGHYEGTPVLVTGDVTDSGDPDQMDCARSLLDLLAPTNPVLVVPGNHDYSWKGIVNQAGAWRQWVERLGSPLGFDGVPEKPWLTGDLPGGVDGLGVLEVGDVAYFGVDSGDPTNRVHTARGYVSERLATRLKQELAARKGKCRVVFLHHHPFNDGPFMKLVGADGFLDAVRDNCEMVLFGHDHHLGVWRRREGVPLMVASHKTTGTVFEHHLMINIIEASRGDDGEWSFWHRLELA